MLILDARSGRQVQVGKWMDLIDQVMHYDAATGSFTPEGLDDASYRLVSVDPGLLTAAVVAEFRDGQRHHRRLPIRYMHPKFPFRRVLFIPS